MKAVIRIYNWPSQVNRGGPESSDVSLKVTKVTKKRVYIGRDVYDIATGNEVSKIFVGSKRRQLVKLIAE